MTDNISSNQQPQQAAASQMQPIYANKKYGFNQNQQVLQRKHNQQQPKTMTRSTSQKNIASQAKAIPSQLSEARNTSALKTKNLSQQTGQSQAVGQTTIPRIQFNKPVSQEMGVKRVEPQAAKFFVLDASTTLPQQAEMIHSPKRSSKFKQEVQKQKKQHPNIKFSQEASIKANSDIKQLRSVFTHGVYNEADLKSRIVSSAQSPSFERQSIRLSNPTIQQTSRTNVESPLSNTFRSSTAIKIKKTDAINNYFKSKAFMSRQTANLCTSQSTSRLLNKQLDLKPPLSNDLTKPGAIEVRIMEGEQKELKKVFAVQVVVPNSQKSQEKTKKDSRENTARRREPDFPEREQGGSVQRANSDKNINSEGLGNQTDRPYHETLDDESKPIPQLEEIEKRQAMGIEIQPSPTSRNATKSTKKAQKKQFKVSKTTQQSILTSPKQTLRQMNALSRVRQIAPSKNIGVSSIESIIQDRSQRSRQSVQTTVQLPRRLLHVKSVNVLASQPSETKFIDREAKKEYIPISIQRQMFPRFPLISHEDQRSTISTSQVNSLRAQQAVNDGIINIGSGIVESVANHAHESDSLSEFSMAGIGSSAHAQKRAAIKKSLFEESRQSTSKKALKKVRQGMAKKLSQKRTNQTNQDRDGKGLLNLKSQAFANIQTSQNSPTRQQQASNPYQDISTSQVGAQPQHTQTHKSNDSETQPPSTKIQIKITAKKQAFQQQQQQLDSKEEGQLKNSLNQLKSRPQTNQQTARAEELQDNMMNSRHSPQNLAKSFKTFGNSDYSGEKQNVQMSINDQVSQNTDSMMSNVFKRPNLEDKTRMQSEDGKVSDSQRNSSTQEQGQNTGLEKSTNISSIPRSLLEKLTRKHINMKAHQAPVQQTELQLVEQQKPIVQYSKMPMPNPYQKVTVEAYSASRQGPKAQSRGIEAINQTAKKRKETGGNSNCDLTTQVQVVGVQKSQVKQKNQVQDLLRRPREEQIVVKHSKKYLIGKECSSTHNDTVLQDSFQNMNQASPKQARVDRTEQPITVVIKSKVGQNEIKVISDPPTKYLNPRERHKSQERITVIKESVLSKSPKPQQIRLRPNTSRSPTERVREAKTDLNSPIRGFSSNNVSKLKLEHDIMQAVQKEQGWDHLHMHRLFKGYAQSASKTSRDDIRENPKTRYTPEPRQEILKQVDNVVTQCPFKTSRNTIKRGGRPKTPEMDEREYRQMRRLEVFYTFTGLLAPKKIVPFKRTSGPSSLVNEFISQKFINSECILEAQRTVDKAFAKCETLPSFCDRVHRETCRLYYKRRNEFELTDLVIIKTSDILFRLEHDIESSRCRREIVYIRKEGLKMATRLLQTNQVVLLIDEAIMPISEWTVQTILIEKLNLKFDAIYTYSSSLAKPSGNSIDVSQIVLDFRLFSSFQMRHKQSQTDPKLFYFVEGLIDQGSSCATRSKIDFNDKSGSGYVHILVGCDQKSRYKFDASIEYVTKTTNFDSQNHVRAEDRSYVDVNRCANELQQQCDVLRFMHVQKHKTLNSIESDGPLKDSQVFKALWDRNKHIYSQRAKYSTKYRGNKSKKVNQNQQIDTFLLGQAAVTNLKQLGPLQTHSDISNATSLHNVQQGISQSELQTQGRFRKTKTDSFKQNDEAILAKSATTRVEYFVWLTDVFQ